MKCERLESIDLLRGGLTPAEVESRLEHVESCAECHRRLVLATVMAAGAARPASRVWKWLPVAASIGLLTVWFRPQVGTLSNPADLATSEPYPVVRLVTRSSPVTPPKAAIEAYRKRDCDRLETTSAAWGAAGDREFLLGVCRYLQGKPRAAREALLASLSASARWRDPAEWYLANTALLAGRPHEARGRLLPLAAAPGEYQVRARGLIERLEELP